ncbi:MAG: hypothetical protein LBH36_03125 [Candidatus Nomurabacteria bacterium]|jgi:5'(3')-deoxyribonucleotidase|nr:hypothetical protein [Candidatus Nomurabacteria bacterium]
MKTLAVDIDNVLAASAESFIVISNKLFGDHITISDYNEDRQKMWCVDHKEAERRCEVLQANKYQKNYLPVYGAVQAINKLGKQYRLVLVTSRPKFAEELTKNWLKQHFDYNFGTIVFAGFWDNAKNSKDGHLRHKGDLFTQVGADIVIDDQLKHCEAAVETGIRTILFGDYAWNKANELLSGITRCIDWTEVIKELEIQ